METLCFVMQLDLDVHMHDANLMISSKFEKSEVIETLAKELEAISMQPDLNSLNYTVKDGKFYVEGLAYETQPPPEFSYDII